jgi:hypothetical protein
MVASWLLGKFARHLSVEPQPLTSVSDMTSTVGTVAGTGSSRYSLDRKRADAAQEAATFGTER